MYKFPKGYQLLLFVGLFILSITFVMEFYFLNQNTDLQYFKRTLHLKENEADKHLQNVTKSIKDFSIVPKKQSTKDAIAYLLYEDKELLFWSNNLIKIPEVYEDKLYDQALLKLNNGYYALRKEKHNNRIAIALIPIFYEYSTNNNYLQNNFHREFKLLHKTKISLDVHQGDFIINKEGDYLFSLLISNKLVEDSFICNLLSVLYLLGFLFIIGYFISYLQQLPLKKQILLLVCISIGIIGIRTLMLSYKLPYSLYSLYLFKSNLHASSFIFPSLGDYWINALCFFIWIYLLSKFDLCKKVLFTNKKKIFSSLIFLISLAILLAIFIFFQIKSLVDNSSFSLQMHSGSDLKFYSIWAYSGATLFTVALLITIRAITVKYYNTITLVQFYTTWIILLFIAGIIFFFINKIAIIHLFFVLIIVLIQGATRYKANKNINYSLLFLILAFSALYLTSLINIFSAQKEQQISFAKAESIKDYNSPKVKVLLETISADWNKDKTLLHLFQDPIARETQIKEHLKKNYFNNSWFNYNVQIFICGNDDKIATRKQNEQTVNYNNCFSTFNQIIKKCSKIGNTPFYESNTYNGLSSYIGALSFITRKYGEVRIFIQLDLKPYEKEQGYLELLENKKKNIGEYREYSFAKYTKNKLRYATGSFNYYSIFDAFSKKAKNPNKPQYMIELDGYDHYIYNVTDSYKIIVSEKKLSLYQKYIAFPYIFFLQFFWCLAIWSLETYPWDFSQIYSFRQQIKITLIILITLVFITVGGVSLYYSFNSKRNQYKEEHKKKIKMLRQELFSNLESAKNLDPYFTPNLKDRLKDYARILDADINIYDIYGVLLSTSEPDIFSKELLSYRMNYAALEKLNSHEITETTIQERIGNLEYSSVYVVLWNTQNEPIAYLNVPFFMKYKQFKTEMQDIIIAVLNINLLLIILALLVAFIISQRITSPLVILREKFAKISLGKENEKINYPNNDEVKGLIDSYNKMVEDLDKSTKLLTQAERENAWREMARQVAHEIKNPLTPMKLNIQFLQRSLQQGDSNWKDRFAESSKMLLNQIDELSAIASSFSDFAKMPKTQKEEFDIIELLRDLATLYDKGEVRVLLNIKANNGKVWADENQLRRAFINLIRNAIQAIENYNEGLIKIEIIQEKTNTINIMINDNGEGISESLKEKIFTPNFTTKNSGMGLGLALTKNIIEQADGSIYFESEENKGTTFYIQLPTLVESD